MKNIKKLTLVTLLTATALTTVACSSQTTNTNNQTQNMNLSAEKILEKTANNHKNLKSITLNNSIEDSNGKTTSNIVVNRDPLFARVQSKEDDITLEQYFDNSFIYYYFEDKSPIWKKSKISDEDKFTVEDYITPHVLTVYNIYNIHKTETDSSYTLTLEAKEPQKLADPYTKENYKKYILKLLIDKNTLLLKSTSVEAIDNKDNTAKIKTEYSNYNSQVDTKLPADATNAKEE